jgi:YegS/Rv2252/BmrU family lipid kinase
LNVDLVVNPIAGNRAYRSVDKLETLLKERVSLTTFITQKKGDACEYAGNLSSSDLILVASGDGTINEVINGLLKSGRPESQNIPVALIPLGTTNVLSKELGIPDQLDQAVDLALTGHAKKISLGRINGHYFTLMAGIGLDGEAVLGVKNNLIKKISGKGAHIVSGLKALAEYHPPVINIKTRDNDLSGYTAVISNAKCYGGFFQVTPQASVTEPVLDICVLKGSKRKDMIRFISGVIRKKHLKYKDVSYTRASEVEVTSDGKVHIQIDGDYFGTLPAKIDVVKDAVSLVW